MVPVLSVWDVVAPAVPTSPKLIPVALKLQVDEIVALTGKLALVVAAMPGCPNANIDKNANGIARLMVKFIVIPFLKGESLDKWLDD
jgi:hypothetical protein